MSKYISISDYNNNEGKMNVYLNTDLIQYCKISNDTVYVCIGGDIYRFDCTKTDIENIKSFFAENKR